VADGERLFRGMASPDNRRFVQTVLQTLTEDRRWTSEIVEQVASGRVEIRCALAWLAQTLQPRTYLEVGVRRGFSLAVVAARSPQAEIYGFDLWIPDYAGVPNPGPPFVQSELRRVGYRKTVHFVSGNTHRTLPAFFRDRRASWFDRLVMDIRWPSRPQSFDLITVDGDHSLVGAYQDLTDLMPHCAVGGAVVFDDIAPDLKRLDAAVLAAERGVDGRGWGDLLGVWRSIQREFPTFRYFEHLHDPPGIGVAIRVS